MPSTCRAPRIIVSALSGGGGKTLLSIGLAKALRTKGFEVCPFKKGPDYIDAAWLSAASNRRASNLDPFFLDEESLKGLFLHVMGKAPEGSIALIEGNRGFFDGMDVQGSCSTASLSRTLQAPVIISLNSTKMTRTAAALIQGLMGFEKGIRFAGVVLNRVARTRHASYLRQSIEAYTDMPVLGTLPRLETNPLPERRMGIASMLGQDLSPEADAAMERLCLLVKENIDIDKIVEQAQKAPSLEPGKDFWKAPAVSLESPVRIGVVQDESLWFYYKENLEALERQGAKLVQLGLLDDKPWAFDGPDALDAVYLGGGFPEDHLETLSSSPKLAQLAEMARKGFPVYAECGGMMVLSKSIIDKGKSYPMAGLFDLAIENTPKPQGLGYVEAIAAESPFFREGTVVRGHEFHYSRAHGVIPEQAMLHLKKGVGMGERKDAVMFRRSWGAYTHIFAPSSPSWAKGFVDEALAWRKDRG